MKRKGSWILIIVALFVVSCAAVGPKSTPLVSDSQPMAEQTFLSGIQCYLEDTYDYDVFFIIQPVVRQALVSGPQYYLADIYDYDEAFLITQPVVRELPAYSAALPIIIETPFFITEPVREHTVVSEVQYYLKDIYDYDEPFLITKIAGEN